MKHFVLFVLHVTHFTRYKITSSLSPNFNSCSVDGSSGNKGVPEATDSEEYVFVPFMITDQLKAELVHKNDEA